MTATTPRPLQLTKAPLAFLLCGVRVRKSIVVALNIVGVIHVVSVFID